jgi:hypothetical protein
MGVGEAAGAPEGRQTPPPGDPAGARCVLMPKGKITAQQREEAKLKRYREVFRDGMAVYKNRNGLSNLTMAQDLGIHHTVVAKILKAEPVQLDFNTLFRLLDLAGLELKMKEVSLK